MPLVQVMNAELEWNARPLSPQMTEAFDKISKQVCSLSEQIAHLQLSVNGMMQPVHSKQLPTSAWLQLAAQVCKLRPPEVLALSLRHKWACPQA